MSREWTSPVANFVGMGVEIDPTLGVDNDITAAINAIASAEGINPAELADGTFAGELNTIR